MTKTSTKKSISNTKRTIGSVGNRIPTTMDDFKAALLVVSLLANAFILVGWLAIRLTNQYDLQVATFLFAR